MDVNTTTKTKRILRIVVPILILLTIGGIWLLRNSQGGEDNPITAESAHPDFALKATADLDLETLKAHGLPIVLDFSADWCQPCREMEPILEKLNAEYAGKAIIKIVDTEAMPEFTANFPVRAIPTQFFYDKDGNPFVPEKDFGAELILYSNRDTEDHALTAHEGLLYEGILRDILAEMGVEAE